MGATPRTPTRGSDGRITPRPRTPSERSCCCISLGLHLHRSSPIRVFSCAWACICCFHLGHIKLTGLRSRVPFTLVQTTRPKPNHAVCLESLGVYSEQPTCCLRCVPLVRIRVVLFHASRRKSDIELIRKYPIQIVVRIHVRSKLESPGREIRGLPLV